MIIESYCFCRIAYHHEPHFTKPCDGIFYIFYTITAMIRTNSILLKIFIDWRILINRFKKFNHRLSFFCKETDIYILYWIKYHR